MADPILKPCPFCGSHEVKVSGGGDESAQWVECTCGAGGPMVLEGDDLSVGRMREEAANRWNARVELHS